MKTTTRFLIVAALVCAAIGSAYGQDYLPAVWVDMTEIQGLTPEGGIPLEGTDLVFPVRFKNVDVARAAISNGYRFVGDDVTWDSLTAEWNPAYPWNPEMALAILCFAPGCYPYFDLGTYINYFRADLSYTTEPAEAVGVGFAGLAGLNGTGLPSNFDDIAYYIKLSGVHIPLGGFLTMDTTWWEPANYWIWVGVPEPGPYWGGPYSFETYCCPPPPCLEGPYTECWPQPTALKALENDRVLEVYVYCQDPNVVDMASVRVNGIPNYLNDGIAVWDAAHERIWTNVFIMRFLGASNFRPIPAEGIQSTYNVTYNTTNVGEVTVTGDFVLTVTAADVTFDGQANLDDVILLTDYLFRDGKPATLWNEEMSELMDIDGSGRFDLFDIQAAIDAAGL